MARGQRLLWAGSACLVLVGVTIVAVATGTGWLAFGGFITLIIGAVPVTILAYVDVVRDASGLSKRHPAARFFAWVPIRLLGVLSVALGTAICIWGIYNLFVQRLPEFRPMGPLLLGPAMLVVGFRWLRGARQGSNDLSAHVTEALQTPTEVVRGFRDVAGASLEEADTELRLRVERGDLSVTVTGAREALEWFVDVVDASGSTVSDWWDYSGYDASPNARLTRNMAVDLQDFLNRLTTCKLRLVRASAKPRLEWLSESVWQKAVPFQWN